MWISFAAFQTFVFLKILFKLCANGVNLIRPAPREMRTRNAGQFIVQGRPFIHFQSISSIDFRFFFNMH